MKKRKKRPREKHIHHQIIDIIKGFTLIELLIVIAILGILAAAVLVAINPGKRMAEARDTQRKNDIGAITNALISYEAISSSLPGETMYDTSRSSSATGTDGACNPLPGLSDWATISYIFYSLITQQELLEKLPTDPKNNSTYHYRYEPRSLGESPCSGSGLTSSCRYWIGGRLEAPKDSSKPIYRCSDIESLADGTGCKEVADFYQ